MRYHTTRHYYDYVRNRYYNYVYLNWIFWPSTYSNGYHYLNGYPYFVYNGYQYRYSYYDTCNYQLIDTYNHQVVQNYWNMNCVEGYDRCAWERDRMNDQNYEFRFTCAETYRDHSYDFSYPTYDSYNDDYYGDYYYGY